MYNTEYEIKHSITIDIVHMQTRDNKRPRGLSLGIFEKRNKCEGWLPRAH